MIAALQLEISRSDKPRLLIDLDVFTHVLLNVSSWPLGGVEWGLTGDCRLRKQSRKPAGSPDRQIVLPDAR
jgi:hypothetical protein